MSKVEEVRLHGVNKKEMRIFLCKSHLDKLAKDQKMLVLSAIKKVTCLENVPINKMKDQDPKVALTVTKKVIWLANVHNLKRKEVKDDHLLNALSVTKLVICLENVQIKTMTKIGVQISVKD